MQHLHHGSQAVGGAARVTNDVEFVVVVVAVVHAHHERANTVTLARSGDQDFLGTGLDVLRSAFFANKYACRFNDQVNAPLGPGQLERIPIGHAFDRFAVDGNGIFVSLNVGI